MFDKLKKYRNIIVTGPQRSGTRIVSKMISQDLGCLYVDELDINICSITELFKHLLSEERCVIHCPHLSVCCHLIDSPETIVIFMKRDLKDIEKSQERIGWEDFWKKKQLRQYFSEGNINIVKYQIWDKQKEIMEIPWLELEYESLAEHPLWVEVEDRVGFKWNDTKEKNTWLLG